MKIPIIVGLISLMMVTGCTGSRPDLGIENGRLAPCPETPNCVSSQDDDEGHLIQPLRYKGTREEARARLLEILESEKRTRILTVQEDYIRAEFTSTLFRFVDDVEFYFPDQTNGETIIQIRSASRIGYSDLGVNRKRVEWIRRFKLKKEDGEL